MGNISCTFSNHRLIAARWTKGAIMHKILLSWSFAFCCVSNFASAQEVCRGILTYTGRDEVSEARENSVAAEIYNTHCEGSSSRRSSNTAVGLEAVVKAIPIKFNFGGASDAEKLNS